MPQSPSARQILVDWANSQQNWVRGIVAEVLATRGPVPEEPLRHVFALALGEWELSNEGIDHAPALTTGVSASDAQETLVLSALRNVENVNRLAQSQEIAFNAGMTVLFGENASGKSGYVRILKRLAAVRSVEDILPDITRPAMASTSSASIEYEFAGANAILEWSGEAGVPPFTRLGIFDSRAALLHVDEDLNYRYMPRDLALFEHTHEAIRATRARLEAARNAKQPTSNAFLPRFQPGSIIYAKILTLGTTTDLVELEALAELSSDEELRVQALRDTIEALASRAISSQLEVARSEKSLAQAALSAGASINSFDWTAHNERVSARESSERRYRAATETAFADDEIPGILSITWRNFIEAGGAYLEEIGRRDYPEGGDDCIYCQQELSEVALILVRKYRDYTSNLLRVQLETAQSSLRDGALAISSLDAASLRREATPKVQAAEARQATHPLGAKTVVLAEQLSAIQEAVYLGRQVVDAAYLQELARDVCVLSESVATQAGNLEAVLTKQSVEREAERQKCRIELRNLEDRLTLRSQLTQIRAFVDDTKWASRASAILDTFRSLLRSLTEESKVASEDLINQDFQVRFTSECESLSAPHVNLEFPGREGAASRRKTLGSDYKLSQVLSEGEQNVIALADFLAESGVRGSTGPLIFDDPVNSLDYRRLQYIVERLVELSFHHQIVVFTHNIWFATALLGKFEETRQTARCSYYDVSSTSEQTGMVTPGSHPRWDTQKRTHGRVNGLIQSAGAASGETQQALIEKSYESIRNWCEVVVEQELFKKVTQRYQPHVQMTLLEQINYSELGSAANQILGLFKKACRVIEAHSQPLETLSIRPTLEELKEDWKQGQDALEISKTTSVATTR